MTYADIRQQVIDRDQVCFLCMVERNEIRPIQEVHHIVPRCLWGWKNGDKHNEKNLIGVCRECHVNHKPHIEARDMIQYIIGQMYDKYGYDYMDDDYRRYAYEMYEERGIEWQ